MSIRFKLWLGAMACAAALLVSASALTTLLGLSALVAGIVVLAIFGPVAWLLARLAYAPVREVTRTAHKIVIDGQLDSRCFYPGPLDDVGKLVVVVNEALVRYDAAHARIVRQRAAQASGENPSDMVPLDAADLVLGFEPTQPGAASEAPHPQPPLPHAGEGARG